MKLRKSIQQCSKGEKNIYKKGTENLKLLTLVQVCQGNKALHQILRQKLYQTSRLCMIYQENLGVHDPQVDPNPSGEVLSR
jgi:hypothetical protein